MLLLALVLAQPLRAERLQLVPQDFQELRFAALVLAELFRQHSPDSQRRSLGL
jgi:hypothetical protein